MSHEREEIVNLINAARATGAKQSAACDIVGISAKTFQRWSLPDNVRDGRLDATQAPVNKLTTLERQRIIKVVNEPAYADLAPSQIVPKLADEGRYIASESSLYRILKEEKQLLHRQKSKPVRSVKKPRALTATGPNQIYTWDITYLPTRVRGVFLYLYLVLDIYSRKIVGWQVHEEERSALAADLMMDICQSEGVKRHQVTLHSDNGSPMKGATMLATLQQLGIMPSFSRPSVSNDNPYSESLFRTLKYRPNYPDKPFADLQAARDWVQGFVDWYNDEHRHSAIKFITPAQRHSGEDIEILANRERVYLKAKSANPLRWSGDIRNWEPIKEVYLNPENQKTKREESKAA
jgi:putative transposase|tara:strand:+ start:719 stop:1768 length:1050 start_codon:yes stop_codon:yes gene_type:complete